MRDVVDEDVKVSLEYARKVLWDVAFGLIVRVECTSLSDEKDIIDTF
jgi:hypothetical protein